MVLEKALEMSNLIKDSDELKRYLAAKKELSDNPELEHDLNYYIKSIRES
jgi:cell fate (sporulation/competence/biofilm development) regulator YlbF (YheA/YmcA/DUF963 family)